ncbi:hyaluronoglucosaminidase [Actinopolyspora xinjiangensis]|uniref:Hyaluronoglucosaminidase n=1 Tax=Actinopolyspora xinjiangensis TaxID=405564 RepID=A0A1H0P8V4_9ACTN|nr:beta-N-acetylglucosaminidase domain-containing protein [Actinopolyspora xinjiangensis]SDP01066.1 hyaluronoglucosaminidase [Actinopolyspora xinjiangensis]
MSRFRRTSRRSAVLASLSCVLALLVAGCTGGSPAPESTGRQESSEHTPSPESEGLPDVVPRPSQLVDTGGDVRVSGKVSLVVDPAVVPATRDLAVRVLRAAGAEEVVVRDPGRRVEDSTLRVRLGSRWAPAMMKAYQNTELEFPSEDEEALAPESYALSIRRGQNPEIVLGGVDPAGTYYAVQTLRQLATPGRVAGVAVLDEPEMSTRGVIEGFYGSPWTHAERMDQIAFYGAVKLNSYVYAPKNDPYHRDRWRDPYPAERLRRLRDLQEEAAENHVKLTFALSPGKSICFSDPADWNALTDKLDSLYDIGVRSFSIPFDDIDYTEWNCSSDRAEYGAPSAAAAGEAQARLLNRLRREFLARHHGTMPLQTVPTEYSDTEDSPYKSALRERLDPEIELMWTGPGVIPESITVDDAASAERVWGRKTILWDNYPVNDYDATEGRLMLGPYAERQPGLGEVLEGLVINPMNQAAASKVVEISAADFAWNSSEFDEQRAWRAAAEYLAGDRFRGDEQRLTPDSETVDALMVFFDLNHAAVLPDGEPWLRPAPELRRRLDEFRKAWSGDAANRKRAVAELRGYAQSIADAPERIRKGTPEDFVADVRPWLRATDLWGDALLATLDGLSARASGDSEAASENFRRAGELADRAGSVRTEPGETRPQGPVRLADGVLDAFIRQAPDMR